MAIFVEHNDTVVKVNNKGEITQDLYTDEVNFICGLLLQGPYLFILHLNGTVVQIQFRDGLILKVHNTGINLRMNYGFAQPEACHMNEEILVLAAFDAGKVYSYNITSQTAELSVYDTDRLQDLTSLTPACINGSLVYVIADSFTERMYVYNETWSIVTIFDYNGSYTGVM